MTQTAKEQSKSLPYLDPNIDIEARITDLLSRMTLEEKVACLGTKPDVPRLDVPGAGHVEGLHGLAWGEPGNWGQGFPIPTTQFPQAIGLGETWDPALILKAGRAEGIETRYVFESKKYKKGGLVVRAPNADLGRDPRWGRTEECFGEDAYFNGVMATAMTKGLQGDDPKYLLTASLLKHFLANSNENGRGHTSSNFDERLYHEYYSVPFRMAIQEGKANGFMAAYNAVNHVPAHVHPMLKEVTRKLWGFDGLICTDGGGLFMLVKEHKYYADVAHAAAEVVKSGIGQFLDKYPEPVRQALKEGLLKESDIDAALAPVFRVMIRLGQLDPVELVPYKKVGDKDPWESKEHKELARLITQKSAVLLKNDGFLPLDQAGLRSVAVIGNNAHDVFLDWYSGTPPYKISPLDGIRAKVGEQVKVHFAKDNSNGEAVALAKSADAVILCVGNHPLGNGGWGVIDSPLEGKESFDRQDIALRQDELVREVVRANPNTVVVLISSFPIAIGWAERHARAILHFTHNSQELGHALADVLFGEVNPGGRLVQTWPRSIDQLPPMMDYDLRHGRTYMYFKGDPLYAFGHGLSYTKFGYSNLKLSSAVLRSSGEVEVSAQIENLGTRPGDEVVQLYVRHEGSGVDRPLKELKAFERLTLSPGEKRTVRFILRAAQLAYWDVTAKGWKVESDRVRLWLGASSADLRLEGVLEVKD